MVDDPEMPVVRVYWRPGCGFCGSLIRGLHGAGLEMEGVNIWEDPDGAAFVRQHANGNETVPTVDIAGTVLVNPPTRVVLSLAEQAGVECHPPPPKPSLGERVRGVFGGRDTDG